MLLTADELGALIHNEVCADMPRCARGEPHQQYYRDRAQTLINQLEPEIGIANVRLAVLAVISELW